LLILCTVLISNIVSAQITYIDEDFSTANGTTPPAGWSQLILVGDPTIDSFHFDNPSSRTLYSPITSPAAIFDSDGYSSTGGAEEVALISLTFDASGVTNVWLDWDQYFRVFSGNTVYVRTRSILPMSHHQIRMRSRLIFPLRQPVLLRLTLVFYGPATIHGTG